MNTSVAGKQAVQLCVPSIGTEVMFELRKGLLIAQHEFQAMAALLIGSMKSLLIYIYLACHVASICSSNHMINDSGFQTCTSTTCCE